MKNLLKYLVPIIMAIAFIDGLCPLDSTSLNGDMEDFSSEVESLYYGNCISSSKPDISLTRQISATNGLRLQTTCKRSNISPKNSSEFVKEGKTVNSCIRYSSQEKSIITCASYIKPSVRLVTLCKLII